MRGVVAVLVLAALARAGGGPETTLVVVNAASPVSRLVANEYVALRDIPQDHVVFVDGMPHQGVVPLDLFLERVWKPVRDHIERAGLEGQIDLITYSADFPYGIDFRKLLPVGQRSQAVGGIASFCGLTYLIRHVEAKERFWALDVNRYFRMDRTRLEPPRNLTADEQSLYSNAFGAMRRQEFEKARLGYEKVLARVKDNPEIYYRYASVLAALGRKADALAALEKGLAAGPMSATATARDPLFAKLRKDARFGGLLERMKPAGPRFFAAQGFRSRYAWTGREDPTLEETLHRYLLSTRLAYTGVRGNSVPEILSYLRAAARADGTRPDGTVYLCHNGNVRSTARQPFFDRLIERMKAIGRRVEVIDGVLPQQKKDVIGAVVGSADFDWARSGSTILPGAIVEHLTSFGAHFGAPGQTKLTALLRHGAAGASGTVTEPLALHQKFPNPMMHFYYARGASLAEAFFQSVWGPYQLMVAGDGLARPFAKFVDVKCESPPPPWTGTVQLSCATRCELWVDGRNLGRGKTLSLDTSELLDGHHDVRIVAVSSDRIETRSYQRIDAVVANGGKERLVEYGGAESVAMGEPIVLTAKGAREIRVLCGAREVGSWKRPRCTVKSEEVGPGPVVLRPRVVSTDGSVYCARPIRLDIRPPDPHTSALPPHPRKPGLRAKGNGQYDLVLTDLGSDKPRLVDMDLQWARLLEMDGEFEAGRAGLYQLVVHGRGTVSIEAAGRALCTEVALSDQLYFPLSLSKGWHPIRIVLKSRGGPKGVPHLVVMLGGAQVLSPLRLRHWTYPAVKTPPAIEGAEKGKPIQIPSDGIQLTWKRAVRNIAGLTFFPVPESQLPQTWVVETSSGYGKWNPVKEVKTVRAKAFVELTFKPVRARKMRIRGGGGAPAKLARLDILQKPKKKR